MTIGGEVDPLTGGGPKRSHYFPIVDASEAPKIKRRGIFDEVFGAVEKLRVEETRTCQRRYAKNRRDRVNLSTPHERHTLQLFGHNPADASLGTLKAAWRYDSDGNMAIFPIPTEGYCE